MLNVATYDPNLVVFTFLGSIIVGYGEDTFLTVARNEDGVTLTMGTGGDGVRNINSNKSGTFTLSLLRASPSNDILTAAALKDELTHDAYGPSLLKDLNGRTLWSARNSWVRKLPDTEYAKEGGMNEWVIETDRLMGFVGGHNSSPV